MSVLLLGALPAAAALGSAVLVQPAPPAPPHAPSETVMVSYVPERVYDSRRERFTDFEAMLADLARADVVLVGEQHEDPNTHRLEVAALQGLMRRRLPIVVSMEMFERDVQPALSEYLAGRLDEEAFLAASRPWPRYATDYRPIVEFARAHGMPVIAANVPRQLAARVAKEGLSALETLPEADRHLAARSIVCPRDDYRTRFVETMQEHPAPGVAQMSGGEREAMYERYYLAQCVKDETMAESIAAARTPDRPLIVHFNGAFHSDFHAGVAPRVERRLEDARVVVVAILPVDDLDTLDPGRQERRRADYLVYTLTPRPSPHTR